MSLLHFRLLLVTYQLWTKKKEFFVMFSFNKFKFGNYKLGYLLIQEAVGLLFRYHNLQLVSSKLSFLFIYLAYLTFFLCLF